MLILRDDTLYTRITPVGNEPMRYNKEYSGIFRTIDDEKIIFESFLFQGEFMGYFKFMNHDGKIRKEGYYLKGELFQLHLKE